MSSIPSRPGGPLASGARCLASRIARAGPRTRERAGFLAIVLVNILAYYPSFFHVFRNDTWTFFYVTRGWGLSSLYKFYYLSHLVPWDRLAFKPLGSLFLGLQKCLFGPHYVAYHLTSFALHIAVAWFLLKVMLTIQRSLLAYAAVLLFSLLIGDVDAVMWPHVNTFALQLLFVLVALYQFERYRTEEPPRRRRMPLAVAAIFLATFVNESGPGLCLVVGAFYALHKMRARALRRADAKWLLLFVAPAVLFVGAYFANLSYIRNRYGLSDERTMSRMTSSANVWGLGDTLHAISCRYLYLDLMPVNVRLRYAEVVYVLPYRSAFSAPVRIVSHAATATLLAAFGLGVALALRKRPGVGRPRRRAAGGPPRAAVSRAHRALMFFLLAFAHMGPIALGRGITYGTDRVLGTSRYMYTFNAFALLCLYTMVDTERLKSVRRGAVHAAFALAVLALAAIHGVYIHRAANDITRCLSSTAAYFDQVHDFINAHRHEEGFSFKMLTPPPQTSFGDYVHISRCIDGLFYRYIRHDDPKYTLQYDVAARKLSVVPPR